jgi:hypothetical protein
MGYAGRQAGNSWFKTTTNNPTRAFRAFKVPGLSAKQSALWTGSCSFSGFQPC